MPANRAVPVSGEEVESLMEAGNGDVRNDQRRAVWPSARVVVKTSLFIAGAIAAVAAVTSLLKPATHTKASGPDTVTLDEVVNEDVALVQGMYAAWGGGKFTGDGAKEALKKFFADDVVMDLSLDVEVKDYAKDLFKVFKGIDGVAQANKLVAETMKAEDPKAQFFGGRPGQVFTIMSSKNTGVQTGVSTISTATIEWTIKNGKIAKLKRSLDHPMAMQEIFDPKSSLAVIHAMMAAWGAGKSFDDLLSDDVVLDATVGNIDTPPLKIYHGIDGFHEGNKMLATEFEMKNPKFSFTVDANDKTIVYMTATGDWTAKKDSSVSGHSDSIIEYKVEDGKITKEKYYYGSTDGLKAWSKLTA